MGEIGDKCAAFASLESVQTSTDFTISAMGDELTQNKSEQHICGRESLLREKDVQFFNLT